VPRAPLRAKAPRRVSVPALVRGSVALAPSAAWLVAPSLRASLDIRDGRAFLACAGLEVEWDPAHVRHIIDDDALLLAWGRPRDVATRAPADLATLRFALEQDAVAALARLDGAFALALVSRRPARVLLGVDRFSMETVCHGVTQGSLGFADRADAVPVAHRSTAWQSVYDYAYFHAIPAPATLFREVRRLCHGTFLEAAGERVREARWWTPRFEPDRTPLREREAAFREAVENATAAEMHGGETVGCFLSGGTDSSTIAGMAGRVAGSPARTYSIGFAEQGYDEMEYARIAARHFATTHHEYYVTADDVVETIPRLAASLDQPFGNSSAIPAYCCARMARADGVTRMLAGDGGDELFGGNTRYRLQLALEHYARVPAFARTALAPLAARFAGRTRVPGLRQLAGYIRTASVPLPERLEGHNLLRRIGAARMFADALVGEIDMDAPLAQQRATYAEAPATHALDRMLFYDWKYTLADADLPKVRTATTLAGVGVGYPLLAAPVVAQALRLAPRDKVRGTRLRWFFKHALRGFLPQETLRKRKHGFGMPFGAWAMRHAQLSALCADSLASLEGRGLLRPGFRDELLRTLLPAHPGYYGELVYILVMLEQWLAASGRGALPAVGRATVRS